MGMGSSNGHGYSAGREFLSIQKVFDKTKSISIAARAGAEDFVGFKKEFADLSTILSFSYEVKDGRWMNNSRTLDEINDPQELGGDRILRVLAAEKTMGQDSGITQAAVISEDLGFGRSYLYLFSKNADKPNEVSALAIEYQGSKEALGNFVQNLWSRSDVGGGDARKVDFSKPIFFTNSTSVGVHDVFDLAQKSLQKEGGAENTRSYLSRFARDVVDFPSVLARQEIEIENLTRKYQEQMLKDTDIVSGIASMVAGSVAITAKWQETIDARSKFSATPPPDFQFRSSTGVSEESPLPKYLLETSVTDTDFTAVIARTPTLRRGTRQSRFNRDSHAHSHSLGMTEGAKLVSSPDSEIYIPAVLYFIRISETGQEERPLEDDGTSFLQWENLDVRLILLTEVLLIMTGLENKKDYQIDSLLPQYQPRRTSGRYGVSTPPLESLEKKLPIVVDGVLLTCSKTDFTKPEEFDREDKDKPQPDKVEPFYTDRQFTNDGMKLNSTEIDDHVLLKQLTLTNLLDILDFEITSPDETLQSDKVFPHPESPKPAETERDAEKVQAFILRVVEDFQQDHKLSQSENNNPDLQEKLMRISFWSEILTDEKTASSVKRIVAALIYLEIREGRFTHPGSSETEELVRQLNATYPEKVFGREIYLLGQLVTVLMPRQEKMTLTWQDLSRLIFIILCLLVCVQKLESSNKSSSGDKKYSWEKLLGLLKTRNMLRGSARNKKINKKKKSTIIFQYSRLPANTRLLEKAGVFVAQ